MNATKATKWKIQIFARRASFRDKFAAFEPKSLNQQRESGDLNGPPPPPPPIE
jgi:hypothetical protein